MSEDQVFVDNLFQIAKMSFTFGFYFEDFKEFQPENQHLSDFTLNSPVTGKHFPQTTFLILPYK